MRPAPHGARHRSKLVGLVAALAGVALALTGCTSIFLPPKITSTPTDESVPAALAPYYHQVLTWKSCGNNMQCTDATAPLDWSKPSGAKIKLALIRHLATDGHSLGS